MSKVVRRGYIDTDEKDFSRKSLYKLHEASKDLYYLLNQGYKTKGCLLYTSPSPRDI